VEKKEREGGRSEGKKDGRMEVEESEGGGRGWVVEGNGGYGKGGGSMNMEW
jgi:hypothetical protein